MNNDVIQGLLSRDQHDQYYYFNTFKEQLSEIYVPSVKPCFSAKMKCAVGNALWFQSNHLLNGWSSDQTQVADPRIPATRVSEVRICPLC